VPVPPKEKRMGSFLKKFVIEALAILPGLLYLQLDRVYRGWLVLKLAFFS
jgi:hypothetical protein